MTRRLRCFNHWIILIGCTTLLTLGLSEPAGAAAPGPSLSGSLATIPAGTAINLTSEGEIDWVHWGLYTETSVDRKANVVPQISDFALLDNTNGYAYAYQFSDNENGYSWSDGSPTPSVIDTTTGVWAYGVPSADSGFSITAPADTATRTLKVYVGAYAAHAKLEAYLSDGSAGGYTNTSFFNMTNGPSGVFTLTYAAGSAGQSLTVRWTLSLAMRPSGNGSELGVTNRNLTATQRFYRVDAK